MGKQFDRNPYNKIHERLYGLTWLIPILFVLLALDSFLFFINFLLTSGDPAKNLWRFSLTADYRDMGTISLVMIIISALFGAGSIWLVRPAVRYQIRKNNYLYSKNPDDIPPAKQLNDWTTALTVAVWLLTGLVLLVFGRFVLSLIAFIQNL